MLLTVYRTATAEKPHFGRGSFWALKLEDAVRFKRFLEDDVKIWRPDLPDFPASRVYRLEEEVDDELVLEFDFLKSMKLGVKWASRELPQFAALEYKWILMFEPPYEKHAWRVAIRVDAQPAEAFPLD